jgi:hypothetical protein
LGQSGSRKLIKPIDQSTNESRGDNLAKVGVEGSNPFARSNVFSGLVKGSGAYPALFSCPGKQWGSLRAFSEAMLQGAKVPIVSSYARHSTPRLRSKRRTPTFMPPFHELHMEPIFACACDSFFTRHAATEDLDAAIRWMTAPVAYDESRLINAMSALENILDRCGLDEVDTFINGSAFRRVASRVRELLREVGVPEGMAGKVPELNRRSLAEKVMALLAARSISVHDMPEDWLATVVRQRNTIVHTGVSGDFGEQEPDTLDHTIWVREIVTRIILERLGFEGAFRSWLHHDEQLHFPDCIPVQEWVARREATARPPP